MEGRIHAAKAIESPPATALLIVYIRRDRIVVPVEADMHRGFEVAVVLAGRQERFSSGFRADLSAGVVWLSALWEAHAWRPLVPETVTVSVHFAPEFLGDARFEGISWLSLFACSPERRPRVGDGTVRREMMAVAQDICAERGGHVWEDRRLVTGATGVVQQCVGTTVRLTPRVQGLRPAWDDGVRISVLRLLLALYRGWEHREHTQARQEWRPSQLARIMPAIELTMARGTRVRRVGAKQAAEACKLSPAHFRSLFAGTMGMTFGQFELRQRLALGERLLLTTDLPMDEIADRCGFTDASHFVRVFSKTHGKTPGLYRREAWGL